MLLLDPFSRGAYLMSAHPPGHAVSYMCKHFSRAFGYRCLSAAWRRHLPRPSRYGEASATAAGSGRRRAPFSTDNGSHTHTARSLACPLLTLSSSARSFSNGIFRSDGAPCARPLLPSSDRSAGQRNQPSHSTVLARSVCPFVCVAALFPCSGFRIWVSTSSSPPAYCTRAHTELG